MEDKLVNELRKGILAWYPFSEDAQVLYLGISSSPVVEFLQQLGIMVECREDIESIGEDEIVKGWGYEKQFDYIVAIHTLEYIKSPQQFLNNCKAALKTSGKLLLAMGNRLGLRYFCGDRDPYTNRNFDGIENYRRVSSVDLDKMGGRVRDKATVEKWLKECGFVLHKCFSVFPDIDAPQFVYAENYLPEEELYVRYTPYYHYPDTVFLEEMYLYDDLIRNNMFHQMANAYLFECSLIDSDALDYSSKAIKHATLSMDRGESSAMATIIYDDDTVIKKALYPQGIEGLHCMQKNHEDLKTHGITVIEGKFVDDAYIMPYIKGEIGTKYLQKLLREDKNAFIREMDNFRQLILKSSEHVTPVLSDYERREQPEIEQGIWLKRGYFDLVPLNAFYVGGEFMFIDQEFCIENYPANAIITRLVDIVYGGFTDLETILPRTFFWKRYKMEEQVQYLRKMSAEFLYKLRHKKDLRFFYEAHGINSGVIHSNRQRMNFSADEYQQLFVNIFNGLDKYKIIIFGSGNFAKKFVELYSDKYHIEVILDNNKEKWGCDLEGIKICSPDKLKEIPISEYKVIICIKNYLGVLYQLKEAGITNLGIYDTDMIYPAVKVPMEDVSKEGKIKASKKYHTGYIAGVFDLYHIGHLNMFKRAKEQCEYLIVGVVSDEGVRKNKKTMPVIPFEERIEMVRSCKYVDEAVEIPFSFCGTRDAYRLYHFDVQFSGSDYENDPNWLAERDFLRKHGSDMVFFPYTEGTSSTKIKAMIEKSLL